MRDTIRHVLASLAYRTAKALRDAPEGFPSVEAGEGVRTPLEILAHMADLMGSAAATLIDREADRRTEPETWPAEEERFFEELTRTDKLVASGAGREETLMRLLQGPIADALTHVGQLALLRRIAGSPIPEEIFYRAEIVMGRVGRDQEPPPE